MEKLKTNVHVFTFMLSVMVTVPVECIHYDIARIYVIGPKLMNPKKVTLCFKQEKRNI